MEVQKLVSTLLAKAPKDDEHQRMMFVVKQLNKIGIKGHYDPPGGTSQRLLLYSNRYNVQNWHIARECNGIILDTKDWAVICRPPELPLVDYNIRHVAEGVEAGKYDIYSATDGTVVNLYRYQNRWAVSSARGIEVNNLKWCGITYWQALLDCGLDEKQLEVDTQYTFGFTHPTMHPMQTARSLRFIASHKNDQFDWKAPEWAVGQQRAEFKSLPELQKAMEDPKSYGYVLRPRDHRYNTVILESARMRTVRQMMYDRAYTKDAAEIGVNRQDYVVTQNALDDSKYIAFSTAFPSLAASVASLRSVVSDTATKILAADPSVQKWTDEVKKTMSLDKFGNAEQLRVFLSLRDFAGLWCRQVFAPVLPVAAAAQ